MSNWRNIDGRLYFEASYVDGLLATKRQYEADIAAARERITMLEQAHKETHKELASERERRTIAQEAIMLHWEPKVARLERENARLRCNHERLGEDGICQDCGEDCRR